MVYDADAGIAKAEDQVQAKPEDPVGDSSCAIPTERAAIDEVEDAESAEHAEDGTRCANGKDIGVGKEVGDNAAGDARKQVNRQVTPLTVENLDGGVR